MKMNRKALLISAAGWVFLCLFFLPVRVRAGVFQIKTGYEDQNLSEYDGCLSVTADDIRSGTISFNNNRLPVFLGDRWQLCWIHSITIQNLIQESGIEDLASVASVNLGNEMVFTGEEIRTLSTRSYNVGVSSAMYYDGDGSLKIRDSYSGISSFMPEELALFYEAEDVAIGGSMDNYYDSGIIGRKWGEFYHRASSESVAEACLDRGLTLFYGQLDPFDVNRPIEGIHTMYITLKGKKPSVGEGSRPSQGEEAGDKKEKGKSGNNKNSNGKSRKTRTKKASGGTTKKSVNKKKTAGAKTSKKGKTDQGKETGSRDQRSSDGRQADPAGSTQEVSSSTALKTEEVKSTKKTKKKAKKEKSTEPGPGEGGKRAEASGSSSERKKIVMTASAGSKPGNMAAEMEPDKKVIPLLILCMLAGGALCVMRFRTQLGGRRRLRKVSKRERAQKG